MKIVIHPNKILNTKAKTLDIKQILSKATHDLIADMSKTMLKADGAGLAAPQIGKSIRLAVINTKDGVIALINPRITKKSLIKEWGDEGCLSVPGYFGEVKRYKKITCEYTDRKGAKKIIKAQGLLARVIQHELDHLDGILFISKSRNLRKVEDMASEALGRIREEA